MPPPASARLLLQPWHERHTAGFLALAQDPAVMRYINGGVPLTEPEARAFVLRQIACLAERGYCRWRLVARDDGAFVGFCAGEPVAALADVEIGWWIIRERWGRGLATEAAQVAFDDLRTRVGLRRIVSIAQRDNEPSIRIMKALGFTFERAMDYHGFPCVLHAWVGAVQ